MEDIRMSLRELIDTAKERLRELQYAPATINAFSRYWRELLEYAEKVQTQYFSVTLGEDYLREVCHIDVAEGTHDPNLQGGKLIPLSERFIYWWIFRTAAAFCEKGKKSTPPFQTVSWKLPSIFTPCAGAVTTGSGRYNPKNSQWNGFYCIWSRREYGRLEKCGIQISPVF